MVKIPTMYEILEDPVIVQSIASSKTVKIGDQKYQKRLDLAKSQSPLKIVEGAGVIGLKDFGVFRELDHMLKDDM